MTDYDYITKESMEEHNPNQPRILDHSQKELIAEGSGSGKINSLLHMTKQQNRDDDFRILLNIQVISRMSIKILKSTNNTENVKH